MSRVEDKQLDEVREQGKASSKRADEALAEMDRLGAIRHDKEEADDKRRAEEDQPPSLNPDS